MSLPCPVWTGQQTPPAACVLCGAAPMHWGFGGHWPPTSCAGYIPGHCLLLLSAHQMRLVYWSLLCYTDGCKKTTKREFRGMMPYEEALRKILCKRDSTKSSMVQRKQYRMWAGALADTSSRRAGWYVRRRRECRPVCRDILKGRLSPQPGPQT